VLCDNAFPLRAFSAISAIESSSMVRRVRILAFFDLPLRKTPILIWPISETLSISFLMRRLSASSARSDVSDDGGLDGSNKRYLS